MSYQDEDEARSIGGIRSYEVVLTLSVKANNYKDATQKADLFRQVNVRLTGADVAVDGPRVPPREELVHVH